MAIFIAVRSTDSSVRKMRETAKFRRPSRAGYSMQRSQYGLPTEPCDHIQFVIALTTKVIISSPGTVVKGFGEIFLTVVKVLCWLQNNHRPTKAGRRHRIILQGLQRHALLEDGEVVEAVDLVAGVLSAGDGEHQGHQVLA